MVSCPSLTRHRLYRFYLEVIVRVDHYDIMIVINKGHHRPPHIIDCHKIDILYEYVGLCIFQGNAGFKSIPPRVTITSRVSHVTCTSCHVSRHTECQLMSGPRLCAHCGHNTPGAVLGDPQEHRYDRHKISRQSPDTDITMPHTNIEAFI